MSEVEYGPLAEYYELINEAYVRYEDQAALALAALAAYGRPGSRPAVLDVACGPGLLMKRLQGAGARAVGIDLAEALLRQGVGKLGGRFARADMRRLPFSGGFDLTCCLLHTINYMTRDDDLLAALGSMAAALKPGGVAIIDFIAYEPRSEWNGEWAETVQAQGVKIVGRHHQTADWRRMIATDRHTYTVDEEGRSWEASGVDELRITSPEEMQAFARRAGLEPVTITGKYQFDTEPGFDGGVLVARKEVEAEVRAVV